MSKSSSCVPIFRRTSVAGLGRLVHHQVVDVDAVRVSFPGGWGLVRASNTGPVLVLRCEADSPERLATIRADLEGCVRATTAKVQPTT
jgi:phosphomannomutase